jgi:phosphate acetyltransferase
VTEDFRTGLRHRAADTPRALVFPEGDDARVLEAVAERARDRRVRPVVLGAPEAVRTALQVLGMPGQAIHVTDHARDAHRLAPGEVLVVDPGSDFPEGADALHEARSHRGMSAEEARDLARQPLVRGALMVRLGEVAGSVAGAAHSTGDVLRAAFWCVGPAPGIETVSSSFYMVVPDFRGRGPEVLTYTDGAVVPSPTAAQLCDIAVAAADARARIVGDDPRVAFLSYSTHGSARGEQIDRVVEALEAFRARRPDVPADGELQADAALIADVARRKAPESPVPGDANVLVFPDLGAGNIAYKLTQRLARAAAIGPIVQGLNRPLNDLSRGASVADIVDVACITALSADDPQPR